MTDKVEEIRKRHLRDDRWRNTQSNEDRAILLAEVDRLRADLATQQGCCDGAAAQDAHVRREREEHRAEVAKLRAEYELLRADILDLKADAWDEGYQDHADMVAGIVRKPSNPYR